ncbi:MAG: hypothetical protein JSR84_16905 [Proteobacteria bacterium]|nr:hypothetical protein [Pseudomonadota bacterium]
MRTMSALLAAAAMLAAAMLAAPAARAQDPACTKDLQGFVGLTVTATRLASVGTVMAEHFLPRTGDGRSTTVTRDDIRQLQGAYRDAGIEDCEMRREFQAMAATPVQGGGGIPGTLPGTVPGIYPGTAWPGNFAARAVCGGARGSSYGQPSAQQALAVAVDRCVARGGDPNCCAAGAFLTR